MRALGGIVDGAATAEAFHVLIGRPKEALRVLVPTTAFGDAAALAEHLRDRIIAKTTAVDIAPQVAKRGGPDTNYARNVAAQRMSAGNPDRQAWEREWTAMRNRRDLELRELATQYRVKAKSADSKEKKRLRLEQRKAEAAIVRAHQPEDFGAWLHSRKDAEEETLDRLNALYKQRTDRAETLKREAERSQTQSRSADRAPEPPKKSRARRR